MSICTIPQKEKDRLREMYPDGTRVKLIQMDDVQAPPKGTLGTVIGIDDTGSLLMRWDSGGSLSVLYGVDEVEIVKEKEVSDGKFM